ncbi:hypothetical protein QYE76_010569 [Lolium multiflorum]|uniref:Transposase (putative) gypsy type domain-containing protein n=1 Tax=Lolium multiflorum TaxID=4521 RepID=A0AAD8X4H2_LOLMU|nr:hypothetical protein QYE76_010569 [Lolium multiflorum]
MVLTKALVERGFSFPPSDFFLEILKAYGLQPHNISPNSVLAISNHVTLCEGHLRVTPELSLFQYYFTVKKERIRQSSELATCGTITFMIRSGRVYPHTDRNESARYWSAGFFYLKDVSDPANVKKLPPFKNCPATELPTWSHCPHLSESPQLTRAVRRICKLTEEGLTGKDLTLSWFTKRIQPLQHRDRLMFQYTGCDDPMRATKDNLSADAIDKRIRVLIKVPRELHVHVCNKDIHMNGSGTALEALEENELGTLLRVPSTGNADPEAASEAEAPEASRPAKRKKLASSSPYAKRGREVLSTAATRKAEAEKKRLSMINTSNRGQPATQHFFKPSGPRGNCTKICVHVLEQITEIEGLRQNAENSQQAIRLLESRLQEETAKHSKFDELSAKVQVLEAENESLKNFVKTSASQENQARKELNEKLEKSQGRVISVISKNRVLEAEAEAIDKLIFRAGFHQSGKNLQHASRLPSPGHLQGSLPLNGGRCTRAPEDSDMGALLAETEGYEQLFVRRVDHSFWYNQHDLPSGFSDAEEEAGEPEYYGEGSGSSGEHSGGNSCDYSEAGSGDSDDGSTYQQSEEEDSE